MLKTKTISLTIVMTTLAITALALDAKTSAQIESLFRDYNQVNAPGASVMVIRDGKPIFAKGFGLAELEKKTPCTTNTNFRLASVTKQFTAMAVLILAERKKLSLDERLTDFFPEFPAYGKQITVRHLLTHTSGLIAYEDVIPAGTTIPVLDQDVLRILLTQDKTYFPPGSQFRYSNSGFALLALIVEARSGEKFAHFLKENIFEPLKMANTLAYEQGLSIVPNRAFGHTPKIVNAPLTPALSPSDGEREIVPSARSVPLSPSDGERVRVRGFERTDQSLTSSVLGDGGVYSSVVELAKWDAALYGTKLVSANTLKQAFTSATPTDKPGRSYGFGWFIGEYRGLKEISHSGDTIGFRTRIARFPDKKFTVIILANRPDAKLDELPHKIADLVLFAGPQ
jgi:CubicO group peptidase (beta-lactamase class C family)